MIKTSVVGSMSLDLHASTNLKMAIFDLFASDTFDGSWTCSGVSGCNAL